MGSGFGNESGQGVLCPLPTKSLYDHPLRGGFFDQAHLDGLVASIKANGLLEPVLVRPRDDTEGEYEILSGHLRVRAVRQLRRSSVMSRIVVCDNHSAKLIFFTSRILTKGITAIEEAVILREMVTVESLSMEAAGSLFGHSKSWVSRRLKLLASLEPWLRDEISRGLISPRVAEELCRLFPRGNGNQARVLKIIKKRHLNKEEARELVTRWLQADESERARLEESFRKGPAERVKPRTLSAPEAQAQAKRQLRLGTDILDGVLELVTDTPSPIADWWPVSAWHRLDKSFRTLAIEAGTLGESEGGTPFGMAPTK